MEERGNNLAFSLSFQGLRVNGVWGLFGCTCFVWFCVSSFSICRGFGFLASSCTLGFCSFRHLFNGFNLVGFGAFGMQRALFRAFKVIWASSIPCFEVSGFRV